MGKQMSVGLIGSDEAELLFLLEKEASIDIYPIVSRRRPSKIQLPLEPLVDDGDHYVASVIMATHRHPKDLLFEKDDNGYHTISHIEGEAIEYTRPRLISSQTSDWGNKPRCPWIDFGRIWFAPRDLAGNRKSEQFVDWAHGVFQIATRNLTLVKPYGYLGADALKAFRAKSIVLERPR